MNYHRRFIQDYSSIARPLHKLMKDVKFKWSNECQWTFEKLKEVLTTALVLVLPKDTGFFRLETDTSNMVTGAVLYQQQDDGTL
jgi:hypothetical protein